MKSLSNFSNSALTRSEMKNVKGGIWNCQCNGVGTWTGNYKTMTSVANAISNYCSNGGTCTQS